MGIKTKFGIRICLYPAFQCTKFQGNWIMHLCFITTCTPWRKVEGKLNQFQRFISCMRLSWNLKCEVMTLADISTAKIVCFVKVSWIYKYVKINNSWVWRAGFLGCTTHFYFVVIPLSDWIFNLLATKRQQLLIK